jgi:peptidyl-prolyl cis-trans isomerase D
MLDFLRRSATSVFAWIVLGVLALVFGLSFGLPSDSLSLGPEKIVKVYGEDIGDADYRYQYNIATRFGLIPKEPERREMLGVNAEVLDGVVERIVLAKTAEKIGLGATAAQAEDEVLKGHLVMFGFTLEYLPGKQNFNYDLFKNSWLAGLRVAEPHYLEYQRQEVLARTMRDIVQSSVVVSEDEVRAAYEKDGNKLSLRFARYEARAFGDLVDPTPEDIDTYMTDHADELTTQLAAQGARFAKLGKQHRLYVMSVDKPTGDAATEELLTAARTTLEAARRRVLDGADFRKVAREISKHGSASRGGDLGWVGEDASGLDLVVDDEAKTAEIDAISEVLEGDTAMWVIRVTGRREGDIPDEDARRELAEDGVRLQRGKDLARAAATEDRDAVTGGAALTEVFDSPGALGLDVAPGDEDPIEDQDAPARSRPKAELVETGPFAKGQPIPRLGAVPEIVNAGWDAETDVDMFDEVFEVGDDFVLAGRVSKQESTDEEYQQMRAQLYDVMVQRKATRVSGHFARRACIEAKGKGEIKVSDEKVRRLMTYDTKAEDGQPAAAAPYSVCDRVGGQGGMMTLGLRLRR